MNYVKMYVIAFIAFLVIDAIWLLFISKNLYQSEIGHLMAEKPKLIAAAIFYLIFLVGLVYFVINPGIVNKDLSKLLFSAALFGLITYATYDLTNLATLKDWPLKITVIDLMWGTTLSTAVSYITYIIYNI